MPAMTGLPVEFYSLCAAECILTCIFARIAAQIGAILSKMARLEKFSRDSAFGFLSGKTKIFTCLSSVGIIDTSLKISYT
jgi:hypothetical protein